MRLIPFVYKELCSLSNANEPIMSCHEKLVYYEKQGRRLPKPELFSFYYFDLQFKKV